MTKSGTTRASRTARFARSAAALLAGIVAVVVLSMGTDQALHALGVYPAWGQPMLDTGLNLLSLCYRIVFTILAGYLTARLAPGAPMRHAIALGLIGTTLGIVGAFAAMPTKLLPDWYMVCLAITALPSAWLGGRILGSGTVSDTTARAPGSAWSSRRA